MRTAALLEAAHQDVVVGVQEQDTERDAAGLEGFQRRPDVGEESRAAHIDHHGELGYGLRGVGHKFGQGAEHLRRKVLNDIPAVVLKGVRSGTAPRPGHTRHHEQFRFNGPDGRHAVLFRFGSCR